MYLFVCLNHFYCENNMGSLFFCCNEIEEIEAIFVVVINRQYLHKGHMVRK